MTTLVYSFDVFDTCLVRTFAQPEAVFAALAQTVLPKPTSPETIAEFTTARMQAEAVARQATDREDITLADIYAHFATLKEWQLQPQAVMAAEVSLEIGCIRPMRAIHQRITRLKQQGHRVIFISDMYLPQSVIRLMLVNHGLAAPADKVYVSGDIGLTKHSGHLFDYVLQQEKLQPNQLWHTGDNPHSDVIVPRRLGIKTTYFRQSRLNCYERLIMAQPNDHLWRMSQLAGISRAMRLQHSGEGVNPELVKLIAGVIAPLLTGFVAWVLQEATRSGFERLYFVSRDGQILYKVAQILSRHRPAPECRYLYGSRQAWFLPALQEVNRPALDWLTLHSKAPRHLLQRLNLTPQDISNVFPEHGLSAWDHQLDEASIEQFWQLLEHPQVANLISLRANEARKMTLAYLDQEGLAGPARWSLVDVGWTLKSQRAIRQMLQVVSGSPEPHGFYLGIAKERISLADSGPYRAYFLEPYFLEPESGGVADLPVNALFRNMGMIEQVFTMADHGSVTGYTLDNHRVVPILNPLSPQPHHQQFVNTLHEVVLAYAQELIKTDILGETGNLKNVALHTLNQFLVKPEPGEVKAIAWISIGEDQNETRRQPLARKLTLKDLFYYVGRAAKVSKVREYGAGYAWWAGSIVLSGWWIRILFNFAFKIIKFRRHGGFLQVRRLWWKLTGTDTL